MEKSTKGEYVAVPTSDVDQEAGLPAYQEEDVIAAEKTKSRRRFRFFLIGGAIALLGLTHLCTNDYVNFNEMKESDFRPQDAPEPCILNHLDQYTELKQHMEHLDSTFGRHHPGPWGPHGDDEPPHHPKHHHKHHKHHHGKHDKPHHPPPPPPPPHFSEEEEGPINHFREEGQPPHHRHHAHKMGHPHFGGKDHHRDEQEKPDCALRVLDDDKKHHWEPFCKAEDLDGSSTVFNFSPEEFKRAAIFSDGWFDKGSHIHLTKSSDASLESVKVNVTVYAGRKDLAQEVKVSAFDHEGKYSVQLERGHFKHHGRPHMLKHGEEHSKEEGPKKENCLIYDINVEFPANLEYFDQLDVKAKGGFLRGGKDVQDIEFGSIKASIGRGAVIFDGLKAKNLLFGVLRGVVMGTYQPGESFSAGTVKGATKVKIEPTGENVNITATSTFGPATVDVPADSYNGKFVLYNLFGESSTVEAPNPEDIHVTKFRPTLKAGFYKEDNSQSHIVVGAKLHGGERLSFV